MAFAFAVAVAAGGGSFSGAFSGIAWGVVVFLSAVGVPIVFDGGGVSAKARYGILAGFIRASVPSDRLERMNGVYAEKSS